MESQFTAKDFNGFKYQKTVSSKADVIKNYPELKKYPEFNPKVYKSLRLSPDKIFRYVLLVYTHNIIFESIPSVVKRKREAAILSGFHANSETNTFSHDIELLIKCDLDPLVNDLIIRVIRINKDSKWIQLLAFEEARARQVAHMVAGTGEATRVLMENVTKLSESIEELSNDLLNQDEQPDIIELLYENIITENLGIKPEDIAQARKDGNLSKVLKKPSIK